MARRIGEVAKLYRSCIEDTKAELFSQVACCKQSAKRRLTASDVSRRAIVSKERSGLLTTVCSYTQAGIFTTKLPTMN